MQLLLETQWDKFVAWDLLMQCCGSWQCDLAQKSLRKFPSRMQQKFQQATSSCSASGIIYCQQDKNVLVNIVTTITALHRWGLVDCVAHVLVSFSGTPWEGLREGTHVTNQENPRQVAACP
jgi:hypothetical protein